MFSFFQKKIFLIDHLHGLVDIHNHILPGIDDGAKTIDESVDLIKGFSEFGIKNFVFTPHIMNNYYPNTPTTIKNSFAKLQKELNIQNIDNIYLDYSAEHMIDDNFEAILNGDKVMPLKKSYLLIEMSYLQPSLNFDQAISKIASRRYFPILAHPERYLFFHQKYKKYASLKSQGILFQLNLLSLCSDFYGKEVSKIASKLLDDNLIDYVASDVHNMKQLNTIKDATISSKTLDQILPIVENTIDTFF
ncbi:histidinol phosphatase [Flagellimonas sp. HMM57]|nr:histidinol phosphatase [Flagellimonas sp. HMM57]